MLVVHIVAPCFSNCVFILHISIAIWFYWYSLLW